MSPYTAGPPHPGIVAKEIESELESATGLRRGVVFFCHRLCCNEIPLKAEASKQTLRKTEYLLYYDCVKELLICNLGCGATEAPVDQGGSMILRLVKLLVKTILRREGDCVGVCCVGCWAWCGCWFLLWRGVVFCLWLVLLAEARL